MKSGILKHVLLAFGMALVLYLGTFSFIEHMRQRKGGWQVDFGIDPSGVPRVIVNQAALGITNVQFRFPGETAASNNLPQTVVFDRPITNAPMGQVMFIDSTFLPGTLTFDFFGHEVELIPRVLVVNKREVPWKSDVTFDLTSDQKLPIEVRRQLRRVSDSEMRKDPASP